MSPYVFIYEVNSSEGNNYAKIQRNSRKTVLRIVLVGDLEPLGRHWNKWENNIKWITKK
jgi:hypothetical protein